MNLSWHNETTLVMLQGNCRYCLPVISVYGIRVGKWAKPTTVWSAYLLKTVFQAENSAKKHRSLIVLLWQLQKWFQWLLTHPYYSFMLSIRASPFSSQILAWQFTYSETLVWLFSLFCWIWQLVISDDCVNSSCVSNQFKIIEQHFCHCILKILTILTCTCYTCFGYPILVNLMASLDIPILVCLRQKDMLYTGISYYPLPPMYFHSLSPKICRTYCGQTYS